MANAGVLLSRVEYLKRGQGKNFLIVDAAMNDLVRPAMYDAFHEIVPLRRDTTRRGIVADVVGPICESADCFAKERQIQELGEGEYLALMSAGAYGHVMASRYNARPIPAEVLVKGSAFERVTARETTTTDSVARDLRDHYPNGCRPSDYADIARRLGISRKSVQNSMSELRKDRRATTERAVTKLEDALAV